MNVKDMNIDAVCFIYRDDYYNNESERPGIAEIIVAKNKIGPTGTIELKFCPKKGRFENINYVTN